MATDWESILNAIEARTGVRPAGSGRAVGGGCINQAHVVGEGTQRFFVKLNRKGLLDMFAAEAEGLDEIVASRTVRVPAPVCWGTAGDSAYLVLEYLPFGGGQSGGGARLGELLAAMHHTTRDRFGWHRDNTIGATPQINDWTADWVDFWREHRLGYQLDLAARKGSGRELSRLGERLMASLDAFFTDYRPEPSLLHGDLWSGNYSYLENGEPVIFDPAVYYGDREADLAMTELFGGFGADFYAAYDDAWPRDPGYRTRKTLYNLYHIINHYNLFGGGYLGQALAMTEQLLAEVK